MLPLWIMLCATALSPRAPGPRHLSKCGVLDAPAMTYVLENDVSSAGTCFGIQANNISLNLNGHTVTYGTTVTAIPVYGILGAACWDRTIEPQNPCGGSFENLTVYRGTISQGPAAGPFSHSVRMGQGLGAGIRVHDVTFNIHSDSSIPIYAEYLGTNANITDNVIHNDVVKIQNRHQLHGQSIKLSGRSLKGPATISGNHIVGGAQGGIFSEVAETVIHNNIVSQKGTYTNDFGIYAWSDRGDVYENVVSPVTGRGIIIADSTGERVHDNKIIVIEQKMNEEYGGCQIGGTFGIQFDDNPRKAEAFQNAVLAKADQCDAQALRVTDSRKDSNNLSHDNTYVAERVGNSSAFATGFGSGGATGFTSEGDTFVGDSSAVRFDWDGGANLIFRNCIFGKGANPTLDYVTFSFKNGGKVPVTNIHFIDSVFQNGAARDSTDMKPILSADDWPGPAEYFIDWSVELFLQDQELKPVIGVSVNIEDALGQSVFHGLSDKDGRVSMTLTELKIYNTVSDVKKEIDNPYTVSMYKEGCETDFKRSVLSVGQPTVESISLTCSSLP
jgi:hypothetical protein